MEKTIPLIVALLFVASCGGGGGSSPVPVSPISDSIAPVISAPDSISVAAQDSSGISANTPAINSFFAAVSASDNIDGAVAVSNDAPAVFPLGSTTVTFRASDQAGNESAQVRTVTVFDADAPVISLNGLSSIELSYGSEFVDLGAVATDAIDGQVTVTIQGVVDTNAMGTYGLIYSALDSEGNAALKVTRTVTVTTSIIPNNAEPYISEYAEGSSANRYLEIYNQSSTELALSGYALATSLNGADTEGSWDLWNDFDITASIGAGSVYTICHTDSDERVRADCDMLVDSLPDGNDGLALVKGTVVNYAVLDRVGNWDLTAPMVGWDVCGYSAATKDRTLIKKPFTKGFTEWSVSAGSNADNCAWLVLVNDDWTNIGRHSSTEAPTFASVFELLGSQVILQDYNPADQATEFDEFDGAIENGVISFDLRKAPLNLVNLTNAVEGGDFQDALLKFAIDSELPSAEDSALVDLYITTGRDAFRDSNESQLHCQVALNWQSNGVSASIVEPEQEIVLVVTKPSLVATTTIGAFDVFEVSSGGLNNSATLDLKLMTALNEAVKIAPELLMSLLVPRKLHVRVVITLPLNDSDGVELTELSAIIKIE